MMEAMDQKIASLTTRRPQTSVPPVQQQNWSYPPATLGWNPALMYQMGPGGFMGNPANPGPPLFIHQRPNPNNL